MASATRSALHTPLCERLGIRYPICQAGMAFVARAQLAAAVSAAGGLGVIAAAHGTAKDLREEIHRVRELTDKPFGVDILFASVRTSGQETERFTDSVKGWIDVTLEERVPVLIAGLGNPGPVTAEAHRLGIAVMALCGNVKQARDHAANDVDVIIAQGHEGGGHTGRVGGVVLTPAVVDAVMPRLVVAAGGLADGRGLVAALALGAAGVWMGTRFIATREAYGHDNYKQKIATIDEEGTVVTRAVSGKPNRQIRNAFTREWESRQGEIQPFPIQYECVGKPASIRAREEGDVEHGSAAAGQSAGLIHDVRPVADVMVSIVDEAEVILHRLGARA
jgi:enoyl-[acyl-carrier protein] reductase II